MATAPPSRARLARAAEWLGVVVLFVPLSLWYTEPLWRHPTTSLADPSDPLHNVCLSWWLSRLFLSGRLAGAWGVRPYFYPARLPLALDGPQVGVTMLGLPFLRVTGSTVLAYNAVVLLSVPLYGRGPTRWRGTSPAADEIGLKRGRAAPEFHGRRRPARGPGAELDVNDDTLRGRAQEISFS